VTAAGDELIRAELIRAEHLRKVFRVPGRSGGEIVAVSDVSFEVSAGGSLAIVGESGSGKTTIARMLVGLTAPTSGTITVAGRERSGRARRARERRARGREIQIVFQDPYTSLDRRQRVRDCLAEVLSLHFDLDKGERDSRVTELADMVGLGSRELSTRPGQLSGGQQQRVAIARALAARPRVLVLDESVSALDVSIQAQILNLLADIRDSEQVTYVVISHDLAVVRQITEHALVMKDGEVIESGATSDVIDYPRHPYTKALRASVPRPGWKPVLRADRAARLPDRYRWRHRPWRSGRHDAQLPSAWSPWRPRAPPPAAAGQHPAAVAAHPGAVLPGVKG
jgi:ABC-type glutathione transport system ATPase component